MDPPATEPESLLRIGRYLISQPIASGGMATVHFGALVGEAGFSRVVAVKRLRTGKNKRSLVTGLLDEAHLVSRVQHPNVVPILDLVTSSDEVLVVLEYVAGESVSRLLGQCVKNEEPVPLDFATTIATGVLHGLHAAHDAKSPKGKPLGMVHRDVSPQNVMVSVDGVPRVLDFGIAKAEVRLAQSRAGQVKGKLAYMAPEQLSGSSDRRADVYATAVVLWEMLSGRRLFLAKTPGKLMQLKVEHDISPPSAHRAEVPLELDEIVMKGLAKRPDDRFDSARQMALALEDCMPVARASLLGAWVQQVAGPALVRRAAVVAALEEAAAEQTGDMPSVAFRAAESLFDAPLTEDVISVVEESETAKRKAASSDAAATTVREGSTTVRDTEDETAASVTPPESPKVMATLVSAGKTEEAVTVPVEPETTDVVMSEVMETPPMMPRSKVPTIAAAVLGLAVAVTVGRSFLKQDQQASPRAPAPTSTPAALPPPATQAASVPAEPAASEVALPVASASTTVPIASAPASSRPPPVSIKTPTPTPTPTVVPKSDPAPSRPNCSPPYYVDSRGIEIPKPECFK